MAIYTDVDLSFEPSPNKDFKLIVDDFSIKNSISRLLGLELHDLPFNDRVESFLKEILFENAGQLSVAMVETQLFWLLEQYEPRIKVEEIITNFDDIGYGVEIVIKYTVIKTKKKDEYVFTKTNKGVQWWTSK